MEFKRLFIISPVLFAILASCGGGGDAVQDPLVTGFPIAYVKRPFPLHDADNNDQVIQPDARNPLQFYEGSDLYIRDHASTQARERNITGSITGGDGDVKDVEVSYDGKKLIFALKEDPDDPDAQPGDPQPTWNIWEYDIEQDRLRRIIELDVFSEEGHDVAPHYLPDGRIVFSSSRQYGSREVLLNEGKFGYTSLIDEENEHAMMLHVMDADGTNIRQITYGLGRDMDPYVRSDGKILFTRWDRYTGSDAINIYSVNPDGTQLELLFGAHSHDLGPLAPTIQFTQPHEYPDGRVLTILRPFTDTYGGGDIGLVDTDRFGDVNQPTRNNVGLTGGVTSITNGDASSTARPTMGGRYISVFPLWDGSNRSLISWTPCRLMENAQAVPCTEEKLADPTLSEAEPIYSLYMFDPTQNTKLPIFLPSPGLAITDVIAAQPRSYPRQLDDTVTGSGESSGIIHIRSVYDYDGRIFNDRGANIPISNPADPIPEFLQGTTPDTRQARFLRLIKPFVRPDRNDLVIPNIAFGRSSNRDGLMEIIGYAPIEPDGSVKVRVPANTPFSFQIVDRNGRRIGEQKHVYWITVRNGETLECGGCHTHNSGIPHGRRDAVTPINQGSQDASGIFPGQSGSMLANPNETMAETRTRITAQLNPSVDIIYEDLWSIMPSASFGYYYDGLANPGGVFDFSTDSTPVTLDCVNSWTAKCRTVINFVTHIDPLLQKARPHSDGVDRTCSQAGCHSPVDANDPTVRRLPSPAIALGMGSQLNFDNVSLYDPSDDTTRLKSYRELLFTDNEQILDMDLNLANREVDDLTRPIFGPNPIPGGPDVIIGYEQMPIATNPGRPMIQGNARASRFFNIFSDTNNAIHYDAMANTPILTPSEQKLISEWLDIGAQYYNNPFDVPPN